MKKKKRGKEERKKSRKEKREAGKGQTLLLNFNTTVSLGQALAMNFKQVSVGLGSKMLAHSSDVQFCSSCPVCFPMII